MRIDLCPKRIHAGLLRRFLEFDALEFGHEQLLFLRLDLAVMAVCHGRNQCQCVHQQVQRMKSGGALAVKPIAPVVRLHKEGHSHQDHGNESRVQRDLDKQAGPPAARAGLQPVDRKHDGCPGIKILGHDAKDPEPLRCGRSAQCNECGRCCDCGNREPYEQIQQYRQRESAVPIHGQTRQRRNPAAPAPASCGCVTAQRRRRSTTRVHVHRLASCAHAVSCRRSQRPSDAHGETRRTAGARK